MILAIDDDPDRFDGLVRMLDGRKAAGFSVPDFRVTCKKSEIDIWLPQTTAVLLDYDLDLGDTHYPEKGWRKGSDYLPMLLAMDLPVVVCSSNYEGGKMLNRALIQAGKKSVLLRASENDPEIRWLGWLYIHGVI